jgi:hypothetical protein
LSRLARNCSLLETDLAYDAIVAGKMADLWH